MRRSNAAASVYLRMVAMLDFAGLVHTRTQCATQSLRQQGLPSRRGRRPAALGRFGQRGEHKLHGRVRVGQLLGQLLHEELEAEPAHLRAQYPHAGGASAQRACGAAVMADWKLAQPHQVAASFAPFACSLV